MTHQPSIELHDYLAGAQAELSDATAKNVESQAALLAAVEARDVAAARRAAFDLCAAINSEILCAKIIAAALNHWPDGSEAEARA